MRERLAPGAFVDVLAVMVLTSLALGGFRLTFGDDRWWVVAVAGVVVGTAWSALFVRLGLGAPLAVQSLPAPYVFTAGGVALGSSGLFLGVPDPATLGDVVTGSVSAWHRLAETAPPADSAGVVMLVPYALAMAFAGTATATALGSRRPAAPAMLLAVLLAVVAVLGVHRPTGVLLQSLAFAAVALGWVGHRSNRATSAADRPVDGPREASVPLTRVLAIVVVVGVAAAAVLPLVDVDQPRPRWILREAVAPYDAASVRTPLSSFRRFREGPDDSLADSRLLAVRGVPPGTRVRIAVLDAYDGESWYAASDRSSDPRDRFLRIGSSIADPGPGRLARATFRMKESWPLDWLPVLGQVQAFEFYEDVAQRQRELVRYNRSTGTALLEGGLDEGETYVVDSRIVGDQLTRAMRPWPTPDRALQEAAEFLDVPARAWSVGARSPMDALFRVAARLKQRGRYSDGATGWETTFAAGHDEARLGEDFVDAPMQVGNDEQYAATMALLANRLGIPARVVVGALVGRAHLVRGRAVGAWVEVRVANGTWRTLPTDTFMGRRPPRRGDEPLAPVRLPPGPESGAPPQQQPSPQETPPQPPEPQAEADETQDDAGVGGGVPRWLWLLVPLLLVGAVPALKWVRRARRRSAPPARSVAGAWEELLDLARDLGLGAPSGSRPRQAASLALPLPLARTADVAAFSEAPPDSSVVDEVWASVREQAGVLRSRASTWRKVLAQINPASLARRR